MFEAPIEAICPSTITDLFFLHERGEKVSLYGLSVLSGNELGPVVSAFIIQALGMNWAFFIVAMFVGASFVCMFITMPETKYTSPRPAMLAAPNIFRGLEPMSGTEPDDKSQEVVIGVPVSQAAQQETTARRSFLQDLAFWTRGDPDVNLLHVFLRPFVLVAYPTVAWSSLIYGLSLSWNVILGATVAQLFAPP